MTTKVWISLVLVLLTVVVLTGFKLTRPGYESAGYTVVRQSGPARAHGLGRRMGNPQVAYCHPPFTPPRLRRNEVMVKVNND